MNDAVGVVVRQGDCPCPGSPHAEEIVFLEPEATLAISVTSWKALSMAEATIASQYAALIEALGMLAPVVAIAYAQDVNAAGLLVDTLNVTVATPDGLQTAIASVPFDPAQENAANNAVLAAYNNLVAVAALT